MPSDGYVTNYPQLEIPEMRSEDTSPRVVCPLFPSLESHFKTENYVLETMGLDPTPGKSQTS